MSWFKFHLKKLINKVFERVPFLLIKLFWRYENSLKTLVNDYLTNTYNFVETVFIYDNKK
jgi:hypothetical protein